MMMGKAVRLAVPFVVLLFAFSCGQEKGASPEGKASSIDLSSLFPSKGDIEGVVPSGDYKEYPGRSLFEYMDGGAEEYLALRFERLGVREYETSLGSGLYLTVEVYDMGDPRDARTIYEKENSGGSGRAGSEGPGVGAASLLGGGLLAFRLGRYYVKVRFDDVGERVDGILEKTARFVAGRIEEGA